jgi:hypothetical protein
VNSNSSNIRSNRSWPKTLDKRGNKVATALKYNTGRARAATVEKVRHNEKRAMPCGTTRCVILHQIINLP